LVVGQPEVEQRRVRQRDSLATPPRRRLELDDPRRGRHVGLAELDNEAAAAAQLAGEEVRRERSAESHPASDGWASEPLACSRQVVDRAC
jgi:hypothetical protein